MSDKNQEHNEIMKKTKLAHESLVNQADKTKGLLIVNTGNGKGKSTSAFGTIIRACGHGFKVGLIQFIKGSWSTGEQKALQRFDDLLTYKVMGEGFTWDTQNRERDIASAERAWDEGVKMLTDPSYNLVVFDELNIALQYEYLSVDKILHDLALRPFNMHVIVTGRNAPQALIDQADLVTEMREIKHPFVTQGIKAQRGIEF